MNVKLILNLLLMYNISVQAYVEEKRYPNMQLKSHTEYTKDKKNGNEYKYYENGRIKSITKWKLDKQMNEVIGYYENGLIKFKHYYQEGKKIGLNTAYNEKGKKIYQAFYKNGNITSAYLYDGNHKVKLNKAQISQISQSTTRKK